MEALKLVFEGLYKTRIYHVQTSTAPHLDLGPYLNRLTDQISVNLNADDSFDSHIVANIKKEEMVIEKAHLTYDALLRRRMYIAFCKGPPNKKTLQVANMNTSLFIFS